jgi:hypothetical protein
MIHTKRFIDKVSLMEGRQGKDVILPIAEARGLRDELSKMMADNYKLLSSQTNTTESITHVEITGGKW